MAGKTSSTIGPMTDSNILAFAKRNDWRADKKIITFSNLDKPVVFWSFWDDEKHINIAMNSCFVPEDLENGRLPNKLSGFEQMLTIALIEGEVEFEEVLIVETDLGIEFIWKEDKEEDTKTISSFSFTVESNATVEV
jgi:hypothetical protein